MVVQAIGLLDELDKELNTYAMRVEWYGWHFSELTKIIQDNMLYAKVVVQMGDRAAAAQHDLSSTGLDEEVEQELKDAAIISMGTEISPTIFTTSNNLLNRSSLYLNIASNFLII